MPTSPVEPRWLTAEIATAINLAEVTASREPHGFLDATKLDGALHRPQTHFHYAKEEDVVALAATLLFAIARSHAFIQGNKRTGFTAFQVFLEMNGYAFEGPDVERLGEIVTAVIAGHHAEDQFADIVRVHVVALPEPEPDQSFEPLGM